MTDNTGDKELNGARKAAILLSVLGEDIAAEVFRNLKGAELQRVADALSNLGPVSVDVSLRIVEEYLQRNKDQDYESQGGLEMVKRLLVRSLGEEEANAIVQRLSKSRESTPIERLQRTDAAKLARFLEAEHPQTVALVLGQLGERQASALLISLPPEKRADAIRRLAALRRFSPEMAEKVSITLSQRLKAYGEQGKRTYSGFQTVANIMNAVDSNVAVEILDEISQEQPTLAVNIRDLMFTFSDLLGVSEAQIRELMSALDKKILAVALKGTSEDLKNHFFRTMSSRAVEMLKEDVESLGPVRSKEVIKAQQEIVALARKLEAEGKMQLKGEGNDEYLL
ncbi:flagellar motor switch protein FliG [Granulicella sp. 5B5]|uniref:flagellar motor switch protein FliG n=1 Tax=Granulicella sp. 5B5 TaxID=1617967 RepID=UPI0015F63EB6|nr:flagellar motor switch protein FliG [Granulicella sp. 5B5]QMV17525.1 flagellar motor switch protein FliG [Granulicella sp. 5B5]